MFQLYKDFPGVVNGVFTLDYQSKVEEARILVTVPSCLETLLMGPAHRSWAARVRYVIFDEIHCMREGGIKEGGAQEGSGAVLEHLLLLLRCPFVALSATIGRPASPGPVIAAVVLECHFGVRLRARRVATLRQHCYLP